MLIRIFSRAHQKCLLIVSFFPREGAETGGSGWLKGLEMNFFEKSFEAQKSISTNKINGSVGPSPIRHPNGENCK